MLYLIPWKILIDILDIIDSLFTYLQVHAVEPHYKVIFDIFCHLDRVKSCAEVQEVLFKGKEKYIRMKTEFETSGDYDVAVVASDSFGFEFCELYSH